MESVSKVSVYSFFTETFMHRFVWIIFLPLLLLSCNDTPLTKVQVGTTPFIGETAFYIAQSKGFFKEKGLEVISHQNSAGKESLLELYKGNLDIAHVAELPIVYALAGSDKYATGSDINGKIFANMIHVNNIQKIIARTQSRINDAQDLKNKKIGFYEGTTSEFFLDTFLLEHGIDDSSVEKVNIDISKHITAFQNGEVDAIVSWEPEASTILTEMEEEATQLTTMIDHSTLWLAVSSASFIDHNPEIIELYLQALTKAQNYIKDNPSEAQQLLARKTNSSPKIIKKLWSTIEYELTIGENMLILLEDQYRWLQKNKYIDQRSGLINFEEGIYFEALENVNPQGITVIR